MRSGFLRNFCARLVTDNDFVYCRNNFFYPLYFVLKNILQGLLIIVGDMRNLTL
jgi:hypothetical protein